MPPPFPASAPGGGAPAPTPQPMGTTHTPTHQAASSYAAAVTKNRRLVPRLKPVSLAYRPISYVDNIPAILFTPIEAEQLSRQRENTLIMKFSAGKPRLEEIRAHIAESWDLEFQPAMGYLDPRHVTLNMASPADTERALSRPSNKINNSLFRLFRWSPKFEVGKESSFVAVWVKFYNLPLHYYNEAALYQLGSTLGTVLRVDTNTLDLVHQVYARVCIELDVSQPFLDKLWIGTSKEHGWLIDVEYEGNHAYCSYCGLLGHTQGLCRKKRQAHGKATVDTNKSPQEVPQTKPGTKEKAQWIAKPKEDSTRKEDTPNTILKKPESGVDAATRQVLAQAGLVTESDSEDSIHGTPNQVNMTRESPVAFMTHEVTQTKQQVPSNETFSNMIDKSQVGINVNSSSSRDKEEEDLTLKSNEGNIKNTKVLRVAIPTKGDARPVRQGDRSISFLVWCHHYSY